MTTNTPIKQEERVIKFRAWDKENKIMFDVSELHFVKGGIKFYGPGVGSGWITVNDEFKNENKVTIELMQFTGLHDKNGKEIYDGDIVRAYKPNCYLDGVYEVRWNKSEGAWRYWKEEGPYFMFSVQSKMYNVGNNKGGAWCEVIGNIWENPELLKEEQTQ